MNIRMVLAALTLCLASPLTLAQHDEEPPATQTEATSDQGGQGASQDMAEDARMRRNFEMQGGQSMMDNLMMRGGQDRMASQGMQCGRSGTAGGSGMMGGGGMMGCPMMSGGQGSMAGCPMMNSQHQMMADQRLMDKMQDIERRLDRVEWLLLRLAERGQ